MTDLPCYYAWFEITLLDPGPHKVDVIRLVRFYRHLDLREAWQLVENPPQAAAFIDADNRHGAEECVARFEALGAKVEMDLHFPAVSGPGIFDE